MNLRPRSSSISIAILLAFMALPTCVQASSVSEFLDSFTLTNWAKKQITKQSISQNVKLFNLSLLGGVSLAMQYRYQSEPSYMDSHYTRYDNYYTTIGVDPSAWVEDLGAPFAFGFSAGSDIVFARQFKSQKEASFALPYLLDRIPVTTQRAIEKLSAGDFVSFRSNLSFSVAVGGSIPAFGPVEAAQSTHAILSGTFQVHLYKIDKTKIRLKLIGIHEVGSGIDGRLNLPPIQIVAFKIGNGQIKGVVNVSLADVSMDANMSDVVMIDYMLDLRDSRVAAAYDHLMQKKAVLKATVSLYPVVEQTRLKNELITDFSELEALFHEEQSKPENVRVVDRIFKGSTATASTTQGIHIDLALVRFQRDTYFAQNKITTIDTNEMRQHYLFDTFSLYKRRRAFFGLMERSESVNTNLLFTATESFKPIAFEALVLSREIRNQSLSQSGLNKLRTDLRKVLPENIYSRIPWFQTESALDQAVNIFFLHQIYFPLEAVNAMPVLDRQEILRRYNEFLKTIPEPGAYAMVVPYSDLYDSHSTRSFGLERYDRDIDFIAGQLAIALNPKLEITPRHQAFVELKDNSLFQETGAGFLIHLLPQDQLEKLLGYSLELSGKGIPKIDFRYGLPTRSELYKSILYIQDILNNRAVDLRLIKDTAESSTPVPTPSSSPAAVPSEPN